MMRMLHLGGMEVLADEGHLDKMNEFAVHGDFELLGKHLHKIKKWKPAYTAGKAIKIVSPFIMKYCPTDRPIRVIFMLRDLNEVVASLLAMRVLWEYEPSEAIADSLHFLDENSVPVKYIRYADLFAYPRTTATEVLDWIGLDLDIDKMVTAIDKDHRKDVSGDLVTYSQFTKALVNDAYVVDLKEESK